MVIIKEEVPVDYRGSSDLCDPKSYHIKEEQEDICVSLGGELLHGKEEINAIGFPVSATPLKNMDDQKSLLLLELHPDQIKGAEFLVKKEEGEELLRIQDHGDGAIFFKTEDNENEGKGNDIWETVFRLKHFTGSEQKPPEINGNIASKPLSSSEFADFHSHFHLEKTVNSKMEFSSFLVNKCFEESENLDSKRKLQESMGFSCEDCGKTLIGKCSLNKHMKIHNKQRGFCCGLCGEKFSRKVILKRHMRIHKGKKLFCCDL